jgi:hypothetical protein
LAQLIILSQMGKQKGEPSDRGYAKNVCDGKTIKVGGLSTLGIIFLQQWVPGISEDEPI